MNVLPQLKWYKNITCVLYVLLVMTVPMLYATDSKAQILEKKVTTVYKNRSLHEVVLDLQAKTKVDFGFTRDLGLDRVNIENEKFENQSLNSVLKKLLNPNSYEFKERDGLIIISRMQEQVKVSGKVFDGEGQPLSSANVRLIELNRTLNTDKDGAYSMSVRPGTFTLEASYISYQSQSKKIIVQSGKDMTANFTLVQSQNKLNEVVVVGYGEVKRKDLTGAVSTVNISDIQDIPVQRVDQMLQGRIAGAEVVSTSGEPGAGTSIRIRGTRSISATNEPLYVVDGVMDAVSSMNDINPADIETLQVLKDASSTAIYGSRGSNGVVLITTKRGKDGQQEIVYRADGGISQLPRFLDLMNAQEWSELMNDRFYFSAAANQTRPLEDYPFPNPASLGDGTNWTKEITRTSPYQNHTITASGGSKSTRYYFSGNYSNNQGIILASGMKRYQLRLNLDQTFSKFVKGGLRINYSYIDHEINKADVGTQTLWYKSTIFLSPTIPAYKPDGSFNDWNSQWYSGTLFDSPLAVSKLTRKDQLKKTLSPMGFLEVTPFKGLTIKSSVSLYDYNRFDDNFSPSTLPTRANKATGAYAYKRAYRSNNILNENTISYSTLLNRKHKIDALYGFTVQNNWISDLSASGDGYFIDDVNTNDLAAVPSKETLNAASSLEDRSRVSHLGRLNYNLSSKYYLTLTGRFDAGSNFAASHKWGFFPSAAVKWNLKSEKFLKSVKAIDDLSLRFSAGLAGNDAVGVYQSLAMLNSIASGYIFDGAIPVSYVPSRIANEGLTWEKTKSANLGIDASFFKGKLDLSFELYQSRTNDLLLTVQLPNQGGFTSRLTNIGETSNNGAELTVGTKNITKKNFYWNSTITIGHNKQMVDDIGGLERVSAYINPYGGNYMMYGYVAGRPLNALWGMQYAGVWKNQAEITQNEIDKKYVSSSTPFYSPGRQRYIDQNNDGVLNNDDLIYMGNADPKVYGGLQNSFRYKKFYVNVYFNYSLGGKIYNPTELFMGTGTYLSNQYRYMANAWHPVRNPTSDIPRAESKDDIPNDRFIYDASFLRLKNASVSYVWDLAKTSNNKLKSVVFTIAGNNIFLLKKYNGYDPEVSTESGSSTIRRMDNGAYPNARTVTFSVQVKF
ncbi:SusC/RagA family TonB-linked outer membrane protein [Pedobacter frigoris]|uniref:TonB-dependent receptor n=1 Tax=Pedobacter frigoris TaxID=2571272 RepID=A0A4U1CJ20_9SPHI|nr:TonB-dependent receptor [Pedobacter frigoris]TKC06066.1 TonB-dependent receptor [Pedobacter frigoris]